MNRDQKAAVIEEVAGQITEAEAVFAVDYRGISVPQAAELRTRLRDADASFRVVKNTLTERAADQAGAEGLKELLEGPTAMTFVRGDAAAAAKALRDFRRQTQLLEFKGGWMNGARALAPTRSTRSRSSRPATSSTGASSAWSPPRSPASPARSAACIGGLARQLQQMAEQRNAAEGGTEIPGSHDPEPGDTPAETTTSDETETQGGPVHGHQHPGVDRRAQVDLRARALRAHQGARGGVRRLRDGRRRRGPAAGRRR